MKQSSLEAAARVLGCVALGALAPALSGCGSDCSDAGAPFDYGYSFSVILSFVPETIPADLKIVMTAGGASETVTLMDIDAAPDPEAAPCKHLGTRLRCEWGDGGAGTGSFSATASGYKEVNVTLTATSACNQTDPAEAERTLSM